MNVRTVGAPPPRATRRLAARSTVGSSWFAQALYAATFLNIQLSPGLLSVWEVSALYILGTQAVIFAYLFFLGSTKFNKPVLGYPPAQIFATLVTLLIMIATISTYRYGVIYMYQPVVNTFLLFSFSVATYIIIFWDSMRRYGAATPQKLIEAFFVATVLYCILQFAMLTAGIYNPVGDSQPQIKGEAVFSKILGWKNSRQMMPISAAFQSGAVIPLAACTCALSAFLSRRASLLRITGFVLGAYLLLLLDAQGFLLAILAAGAVAIFVRTERIYVAITCLLPFSYIFILIIGRNFFPFVLNLANARGNDLYGLFTGREFIWRQFWIYFANASPYQILFGNGANGQGVSRLSERYAIMFSSFNPEARYLATLHNGYLQIIVDSGLLGLGCYMALIGFSTHRAFQLACTPGPNALAWRSVAMLITAFAVVGASEVAFTLYLREGIVVITFAFMMVAMCGGMVSQPGARAISKSPLRRPKRVGMSKRLRLPQ